MRTILSIMFFSFCVNLCFSQNILEETGDKFVKHNNIERAIEMYLRAYERDSSEVISAKIAYCYSTQKNVKKTVYWYDKVSNLQLLANEHLYYYTEALLGLARYEDADRWFKLYNANVIKDYHNKRRIPSKKYFEDYFRDSILYTLTNLEQINTKYAEFSPVLYSENLLVFCSDRPNKETEGIFKKKGEEIVDLFQMKVNFQDTSFSKLKRFHKELKTQHHAGPVIFSKDREQVIFTRNTFIESKNEEEEGVNKLHLYHAVKEEGRWQKAISLPFNQEQYSIGHPAVNEAFDIMYFASDMPEGFGGTDIYKVSFKDGVWGKPENLGIKINTKGDEMFPTLFDDNTMYFSSSGHNSMGGLDLFEAELKEAHVEKIKNMGFPLNSLDDDFGLIWSEDRTHGLFSSTRAEGKGSDDLYLLSSVYKHKKVLIAGQTFIKNEGELDEKKQRTICKIVVWNQQTNRPVDTVYTSKFGQFKVLLDLGMTYNFVAKRDGVRKDLLVDLQDKKNYPKHIDVVLERPIFVERDPAMYDVDFIQDSSLVASTDSRKVGKTKKISSNRPKASLPKGNTKKVVEFLLHSDEDNKPLANVEVYILSKENNKFYKYRSNEHGYVKMPVLDDEQTFYLHGKGLVPECVKIDTRKLEDGFYISDKPIKMVSSAPHQKYSFENIYYEYNKATLNTDAKKDLNKLVEYLKLHKSLKVQLSSHTDSRGGNEFNMKLSQKRSNVAVAYVVSKGINKKRIKAVGYGEEKLVNECKDKVSCSEAKHKENRRTKIKVVGTVQNNTKFDSKKLLDSSKAPIIEVVKTQ